MTDALCAAPKSLVCPQSSALVMWRFHKRIAEDLETDQRKGQWPHLQTTRHKSCLRPSGLDDSSVCSAPPQLEQGKMPGNSFSTMMFLSLRKYHLKARIDRPVMHIAKISLWQRYYGQGP